MDEGYSRSVSCFALGPIACFAYPLSLPAALWFWL